MSPFDACTLRLKQQLGVNSDKEVAERLGFSPSAWVGRKNRDSFPENELYALAAKEPSLKLDVAYVLTGEKGLFETRGAMGERLRRTNETAAAINLLALSDMAKDRLGAILKGDLQHDLPLIVQGALDEAALSTDEQMLLDAYRNLDNAGRKNLLAFALGAPQPGPQGDTTSATVSRSVFGLAINRGGKGKTK